jgi:hypothetical protein
MQELKHVKHFPPTHHKKVSVYDSLNTEVQNCKALSLLLRTLQSSRGDYCRKGLDRDREGTKAFRKQVY